MKVQSIAHIFSIRKLVFWSETRPRTSHLKLNVHCYRALKWKRITSLPTLQHFVISWNDNLLTTTTKAFAFKRKFHFLELNDCLGLVRRKWISSYDALRNQTPFFRTEYQTEGMAHKVKDQICLIFPDTFCIPLHSARKAAPECMQK